MKTDTIPTTMPKLGGIAANQLGVRRVVFLWLHIYVYLLWLSNVVTNCAIDIGVGGIFCRGIGEFCNLDL